MLLFKGEEEEEVDSLAENKLDSCTTNDLTAK
jgi:hypothetical protein